MLRGRFFNFFVRVHNEILCYEPRRGEDHKILLCTRTKKLKKCSSDIQSFLLLNNIMTSIM
jgi:hypothetical protein